MRQSLTQTARSARPPSTRSLRASPRTYCTRPPTPSCSALASMAGELSYPVTAKPRAASARVKAPLPQPMSSALPPGAPKAHARSYKYCDHFS